MIDWLIVLPSHHRLSKGHGIGVQVSDEHTD